MGHQGEPTTNPVCKEVLAAISPAGIKGAELQKRFAAPPFGWPKDAVSGAVLTLLAAGNIRAAQDGRDLTGPKELPQTQIGKVTLYRDETPPSMDQRLRVRGLLTAAGIAYQSGQEGAQLPALLQQLKDLAGIHPDSARLKDLDEKRRGGELSEAEFAEWMELQDEGLVHRDIKPQNVMLTRSGAKLLDFNIASRAGDEVKTRSGTPPYQAPDADLTRWDVSTDLFAVGVLLYELLCDGTHPYPGSAPMAGESVIDPRAIRPDLPRGLAEFLIKSCAPYRDQRFSTAFEMKEALEAVRTGPQD